MSEVKVNKISPRTNCGTVQLGDSGDTITIPAGATITNNGTQTGFGRTGTVNWDTTAKTANFTAVSGNGYFVNTTSGAITVTMPASPSAGDIVALSDYAGTWGTNNVNLSSANYNGSTGTPALSTNKQTAFLVYVDGTKGWITTNESTTRISGFTGIVATGGTITCCGDYKIHTFTSPGTFTVCSVSSSPAENVVSYMVVAGGGGGGAGPSPSSGDAGGGGGAGGFREYKNSCDPYTASPLNGNPGGTSVTVTATSFPITVGGGGAGGGSGSSGSQGSNSVFSTVTSTGGGLGKHNGGPGNRTGGSGGSGGGPSGGGTGMSGGAGNTPPVSPSQGFPGSSHCGSPDVYGGGGGGATAAAVDTPGNAGASGGAGATTSISSSSTAYAGGAGGGGGGGNPGGTGGTGGGGNGGSPGGAGSAGTTNTGGGGGGGGSSGAVGATGGSGIVIIRYKFQ